MKANQEENPSKIGRPLKPPHPSNRLGRRLRARRKQLGLTLVALGRKVKMTHGRLAGYELGTLIPGPEPLGRIAAALELDIHELLRLRTSSMLAIEWDRIIYQVQMKKRASMAIVERDPEDKTDIRIRRLQPVDIP